MSRRVERVSVLMRQKLSEVIAQEMKDPRLAPMVTIVRVDVSKDLRRAKVFTSILGTSEEGRQAIDALNTASGFLRRELTTRMLLRTIPFLSFVPDDSIEKGTYLLQRIDNVRAQDSHLEQLDE